jgi:methionyl-tRNA formyltransferase
LRIVFAGTAAFGQPTLQQLVEAGHEIPLVVTQPDRMGGRGMKPLPSGIKLLALELGLPIFQPERIRNEDAQRRIQELAPDLMVVVAYGQILPSSLLDAPRLGTLNVHASLLPRHRGAAPVEWAILSGDRETGVTIMQMDAGVDTGPMLSQERMRVTPEETAETLAAKLAPAGARLLVQTLEKLYKGEVMPTPQPAEGVTHARRLSSEDGKLDPKAMSAQEIDRRVRALGERIGCWMTLNGVELKILKGHPGGEPGQGIPVETAEAVYFVDQVQPPGGRRMSAAAWARGRR